MSHPAFTDEDQVFIRAIMTNPAELTAWLVYADWLDEHDDPLRAGYLRLSVQLYARKQPKRIASASSGNWKTSTRSSTPIGLPSFLVPESKTRDKQRFVPVSQAMGKAEGY